MEIFLFYLLINFIIFIPFKILNLDESIKKYSGFKFFEEINNELIGTTANNFVLIVQINNKEVKFFQEIEIKAGMLKSFPNENLIIINEYEEEKGFNLLNYYIYDKNLKYQLQKKEEFDFLQFTREDISIESYLYFNYVS